MAGALGLDRAYLSLLEAGKRPISQRVMDRAAEVMREAQLLAVPVSLRGLVAQARRMSTPSLVSAFEHFSQRRGHAPPSAQPFYQFLSSLLVNELSNRLDLPAAKRKPRR